MWFQKYREFWDHRWNMLKLDEALRIFHEFMKPEYLPRRRQTTDQTQLPRLGPSLAAPRW